MKTIFLVLVPLFIFLSCARDPLGIDSDTAKISLEARYRTTMTKSIPVINLVDNKVVDAVTVQRARFLVRNIRLRTSPEDSLELISEPYIIDVNLDGTPKPLIVKDIPEGRYNQIEYRIHRMDDSEPGEQPYFDHPDFAEFVQDNRYSIIIEGVFQQGMNSPQSFIFKSRDSTNQRLTLKPLIAVDEKTTTATITMLINGSGWFLDENGVLLDPNDPDNEKQISGNMQNSIRFYTD